MKRKIASRKLKRNCLYCDKDFTKGDVYYIERHVFEDYESPKGYEVVAYEWLICPKCKFKKDEHSKRFNEFKDHCHHPIKEEIWSYIPGEAVMQPDHVECLICKEWC